MAELQLGGKVIATQSGANNPVLASNVVMDNVNLANVNMDNVNINNALASATFPAGTLIDYTSVRLQGGYDSGNVYRSATDMPAGLHMTITGLPERKRIVVRYTINLWHTNHGAMTMSARYNNDSYANVSTGYGSAGQASINWTTADLYRYPLAKITYNTDPNTVPNASMIYTFIDTNSQNTSFSVKPLYWSENSTAGLLTNRTSQNNTTHGSITESWGEIFVYAY